MLAESCEMYQHYRVGSKLGSCVPNRMQADSGSLPQMYLSPAAPPGVAAGRVAGAGCREARDQKFLG